MADRTAMALDRDAAMRGVRALDGYLDADARAVAAAAVRADGLKAGPNPGGILRSPGS